MCHTRTAWRHKYIWMQSTAAQAGSWPRPPRIIAVDSHVHYVGTRFRPRIVGSAAKKNITSETKKNDRWHVLFFPFTFSSRLLNFLSRIMTADNDQRWINVCRKHIASKLIDMNYRRDWVVIDIIIRDTDYLDTFRIQIPARWTYSFCERISRGCADWFWSRRTGIFVHGWTCA